MTATSRRGISLFLAMGCAIASGHSAAFFVYPPMVTVVEYHNRILDHYFMTGDAREIAIIDAGGAGPGWVRTGHTFSAYGEMPRIPWLCNGFSDCPGVRRYYGQGPNSHFFTSEPEEARIVDRPESGWGFEKEAFWVHKTQGTGWCDNGRVAVYRLYNMRWMFNDSNHRYVTSEAERQRMRAMGWADEGARFCAFR